MDHYINTNAKIGMRNIKTALAVGICALTLLPFPQLQALPACFAAIICMQPSVQKSVEQGKSRIIGTLIGGAIGIFIVFLDEQHHSILLLSFMIMMGISLSIYICNLFNRTDSTTISCIVLVLTLLLWQNETRYVYILFRIGETIYGIIIAVLVNKYCPKLSLLRGSLKRLHPT